MKEGNQKDKMLGQSLIGIVLTDHTTIGNGIYNSIGQNLEVMYNLIVDACLCVR